VVSARAPLSHLRAAYPSTVVVPESSLAKTLHRTDLEARQSSFDARKSLIRSNLSLYISRTRLSVRQLPLFVNDALLRKLALYALKAYDNEVKMGKQDPLTPDELAADVGDVLGAAPAALKPKDGRPPPSRVRQAKVVRQADRLDPLTGQGRSKGYGFVELGTHADALRVLRFANANRSVGALLRGWWRDDLASQLAKVEKDTAASKEERDARRARLQAKVAELEAEAERAEARVAKVQAASKGKGAKADDEAVKALEARANRTLMIELSLENAMTVKRREERAEKNRQSSKRKRVRWCVFAWVPRVHSVCRRSQRSRRRRSSRMEKRPSAAMPRSKPRRRQARRTAVSAASLGASARSAR
jgi:nucleolar protein 4